MLAVLYLFGFVIFQYFPNKYVFGCYPNMCFYWELGFCFMRHFVFTTEFCKLKDRYLIINKTYSELEQSYSKHEQIYSKHEQSYSKYEQNYSKHEQSFSKHEHNYGKHGGKTDGIRTCLSRQTRAS